MNEIGRRAWPIDWEARSLGAAPYTADIAPENALHGAVLRSPHAHARINAIDVSAAERMPGVHAVITSKHYPPGARYMHERVFDRPPLADGVVRFVGQEIAAVAAETKEQAIAAAAAIKIEYALLDAPFAISEALSPDAPMLHDLKGGAPPPGMAPPPGAFSSAPPAGAPSSGPPAAAAVQNQCFA